MQKPLDIGSFVGSTISQDAGRNSNNNGAVEGLPYLCLPALGELDAVPSYIWRQVMNDRYIAGFFDGEGSAMILTIRRKLKTGILYRFRPVIKISQKSPAVLFEMMEHLRLGHVEKINKTSTASLIVNGLAGVMSFVERIEKYSFVKKSALRCMYELAEFQNAKRRNRPYTYKETLKALEIRDRLFKWNCITRRGIVQKYSRERILNETYFIKDIKAWDKKRLKNSHKSYLKNRRERSLSCRKQK